MAAMLLAFSLVSTYIGKAIPVIGGFGYWRFSLTPSLIMFSSILLGPIFGGLIGGLSDLIPALTMPVGTMTPNPFITILYVIFGVLPWLLIKIRKIIPNKIKNIWTLGGGFLLLIGALALVLYLTNWLDYAFQGHEVWGKPLLLGLLTISTIGMGLGVYFSNRFFIKNKEKFEDIPNPFDIAIIAFILEITLMVFLKALCFYAFYAIGASSFPVDYLVVVFMLLALAPFNILLETISVSWFLVFLKRHLHYHSEDE